MPKKSHSTSMSPIKTDPKSWIFYKRASEEIKKYIQIKSGLESLL